MPGGLKSDSFILVFCHLWAKAARDTYSLVLYTWWLLRWHFRCDTMLFSKAYSSEVIASPVTISSAFKCRCWHASGQFWGIGICLKISGGTGLTLKTLDEEKVDGGDTVVGIPPDLWHIGSMFTCSIQRQALRRYHVHHYLICILWQNLRLRIKWPFFSSSACVAQVHKGSFVEPFFQSSGNFRTVSTGEGAVL